MSCVSPSNKQAYLVVYAFIYKMFRIHESLFTLAHVFIYPLELVLKQIIHTFCACWRSTSTYITHTFSFYLPTPSHSHFVCTCLYVCVCANGGQSAWIEHFGEQEIMRWGYCCCCYTHRSKWTSEAKKTWATTTIDAIILHESCQKKLMIQEWIIFCLFLSVWTKHQCGCYVQIQMIFFLVPLLELNPLFYIMVLNCSWKCE